VRRDAAGQMQRTVMKRMTVRDVLERVQDIISRETGAPLRGEAEKRLQGALQDAAGHAVASGGNFLSREVTILLADLRGFTAVSENYPVAVVLELLNRYLAKMSEIVFRHGGAIDKFMGDSIMVLFGAPVTHGNDVERALACAVEMQVAMDDINRYHKQLGMPELYMGIGINTGTVMAGLLGSDLYSEYTVIGDEVNLTSRIEAFSLRGQVLISQSTYERCRDFVKTGDPMDVYVKGKAHPVNLREVLAVPSLGAEVPRQEIRRSPRIEVKIPFSYQVLENKIVVPRLHRGTILDISYHGVLAEVDQQLPPFSEIKLDLDLSLVGYKATDIYAKVLKTQQRDGQILLGIEFTSVSVQTNMNIQQFIHLLIQGSEMK
jgi:adenylate cyclase